MASTKKMTMKEFAALAGIPYGTFFGRLKAGASVHDAMQQRTKSESIRWALRGAKKAAPGPINPNHPLSILQLKRIRDAIKTEPRTAKQVSVELHISEDRARKYIRYLHSSDKEHKRECYISRWIRDANSPGTLIACYRLGNTRDAKRPEKQTSAERQAKSIAKLREEPAQYARYCARKNMRRRKPPANDPLITALFGRAA